MSQTSRGGFGNPPLRGHTAQVDVSPSAARAHGLRPYAVGFCRVRRQRVQTLRRTVSPPTAIRFLCTFGSHSRLVWRLEWLTLCPCPAVLPQTSHLAKARCPL